MRSSVSILLSQIIGSRLGNFFPGRGLSLGFDLAGMYAAERTCHPQPPNSQGNEKPLWRQRRPIGNERHLPCPLTRGTFEIYLRIRPLAHVKTVLLAPQFSKFRQRPTRPESVRKLTVRGPQPPCRNGVFLTRPAIGTLHRAVGYDYSVTPP